MMPVPLLATDDATVAESVLLADSACWSTGSFDASELRAQNYCVRTTARVAWLAVLSGQH
jgi:hypothetical protein